MDIHAGHHRRLGGRAAAARPHRRRAPGLIGFTAGGLIYGPFTAIGTALFQRYSPPHLLSRVLATRTALTIPSTALGTLLGGPVVAAMGGRNTLLASGLLTIALGVLVAMVNRRS